MPTYEVGGRTLTEKQYQEYLKARSRMVSERGLPTIFGAVGSALGLGPEAQFRIRPDAMPDPELQAKSAQKRRRRKTARGGRASTIFTSGLGG